MRRRVTLAAARDQRDRNLAGLASSSSGLCWERRADGRSNRARGRDDSPRVRGRWGNRRNCGRWVLRIPRGVNDLIVTRIHVRYATQQIIGLGTNLQKGRLIDRKWCVNYPTRAALGHKGRIGKGQSLRCFVEKSTEVDPPKPSSHGIISDACKSERRTNECASCYCPWTFAWKRHSELLRAK
jgi:hypothetical protein